MPGARTIDRRSHPSPAAPNRRDSEAGRRFFRGDCPCCPDMFRYWPRIVKHGMSGMGIASLDSPTESTGSSRLKAVVAPSGSQPAPWRAAEGLPSLAAPIAAGRSRLRRSARPRHLHERVGPIRKLFGKLGHAVTVTLWMFVQQRRLAIPFPGDRARRGPSLVRTDAGVRRRRGRNRRPHMIPVRDRWARSGRFSQGPGSGKNGASASGAQSAFVHRRDPSDVGLHDRATGHFQIFGEWRGLRGVRDGRASLKVREQPPREIVGIFPTRKKGRRFVFHAFRRRMSSTLLVLGGEEGRVEVRTTLVLAQRQGFRI